MISLHRHSDILGLGFDRFVDPITCVDLQRDLDEFNREPGGRIDGCLFLHYASARERSPTTTATRWPRSRPSGC